MEIDCHAVTFAGCDHETNEDSFASDPDLCVFMVADGMGGLAKGDLASSMAVAAMSERLREIEGSRRVDEGQLADAIHAANAHVFEHARDIGLERKMGATLTAVTVCGRRCGLAHIGDSRAYRYDGARLARISEDHSLVSELEKNGSLTHEEARAHELRNVISRALGIDASINPQITSFDVSEGDWLFLASDGLEKVLDTARFESVARSHCRQTASRMCEALLEDVQTELLPDDLTLVAVKISALHAKDGEETTPGPSRAPGNRDEAEASAGEASSPSMQSGSEGAADIWDICEELLEPPGTGDGPAALLVAIADEVGGLMRRCAAAEGHGIETERKSRDFEEKILLDLLEAIDAYDRILATMEKRKDELDKRTVKWLGNLKTVRLLLGRIVMDRGATPIETPDMRFNPHWHEAVEAVDDPSTPDGTIMEIFAQGYVYRGKVLRKTKVLVSVGSGRDELGDA